MKGSRGPWLYLSFAAGDYGGYTGCNSFGGLGLLEGDRYFAAPAMQTVVGCSDLTEQEAAITGLMLKATQISRSADDRLLVRSSCQKFTLEPHARKTPAERPRPPALLAGTEWLINGIDRQWLGPRAEGRDR